MDDFISRKYLVDELQRFSGGAFCGPCVEARRKAEKKAWHPSLPWDTASLLSLLSGMLLKLDWNVQQQEQHGSLDPITNLKSTTSRRLALGEI